MESQIKEELGQYELRPKFRDLFFKVAEDMKKENPDDSQNVVKNIQSGIERLKLEKINLTKMSCKNLIPDDEFTEQRNEYEKEIVRLSQKMVEVKKEGNGIDRAIQKVDFATRAKIKFEKGSKKDRREILSEIGANQQLKDKKLLITAHKWLIPIKEQLKPLEAKYFTLELDKLPLTKHKSEQLNSLLYSMRRG